MLIPFFVIHAFLLAISMFLFAPSKPESDTTEYSDIFRKKCPRLNYSIHVFLVLIVLFFIIEGPNIGFAELQFFDNIKFYLILVCFSALLFYLLYKIVFGKEIMDNSDELSNFRNQFNISIILYIYSISILLSGLFIYSSNHMLDFSPKEEFSVSVIDKSGSSYHNPKGSFEKYTLYFEPLVNGVNEIDVSKSAFRKIEKGDKVKILLGKGLYGFKYLKPNF